MAEPAINIRITAKLALFLKGRMEHDDKGNSIESFDKVIKRLCGYNEG